MNSSQLTDDLRALARVACLAALGAGCSDVGSSDEFPTHEAVESEALPLSADSSCSAVQKKRIARLVPEVLAYARAARDSFPNRHDQIRWFGSTLPFPETAFYLMASNPDVEIRCGGDVCDGNNGVHVGIPLLSNRLYLCPSLWEQPFTAGASISHVETTLHELAHFTGAGLIPIVDVEHSGCNNPAYSNDGCYGYPNALYLAQKDDEKAMYNAENYTGYAFETYTRAALFGGVY